MSEDKHWVVTRTAKIAASREAVWDVIGGFYTIHLWHPDIAISEVPPEQVETRQLRRLLTFPGQPKTTEELIMMNNADCHYTYKWHAGDWGEKVKNYHSSLRVLAGDMNETCTVQWIGEFDHPTDAITDFYEHGFEALREKFGAA